MLFGLNHITFAKSTVRYGSDTALSDRQMTLLDCKTAQWSASVVSTKTRGARTRAKLLSVGFRVFSERGPHGIVIDDITRAAGVARGTFYNYFSTTNELLQAVEVSLTAAQARVFDAAVKGIDNPVERIAVALLLYYSRALSDPIYVQFVAATTHSSRVTTSHILKDVQRAIRQKLVSLHNPEVALVSAVGILDMAFRHCAGHKQGPGIPAAEVVRMILRSWGVREALIKRSLARPLPPVVSTIRRVRASGD